MDRERGLIWTESKRDRVDIDRDRERVGGGWGGPAMGRETE